MMVTIIQILCFVFAIATIGFGVYQFIQGEVTNGLLSSILSVLTFNLAVTCAVDIQDY
jgi:hypothetical protein